MDALAHLHANTIIFCSHFANRELVATAAEVIIKDLRGKFDKPDRRQFIRFQIPLVT